MDGNEAPVKVGEEYDVMISAVGGKGDGIAKVKGLYCLSQERRKANF